METQNQRKSESEKVIADLHMHSKASDGIWTPREVVQNAKARNLEVIALTDHDTTFGVPEALEEAKKQNLIVIPGIEIDAKYVLPNAQVRNLELLGLNFNLELIQPLVDRRKNDRLIFMDEYIRNLNNYLTSPNFQSENDKKQFRLVNPRTITLNDLIVWYNQRNLDQTGRPYENPFPFLSKMTLVQYIADNFLEDGKKKAILSGDRATGNAFKKEYKEIIKTTAETKPTFYEAIKAVKDAGGIAILAHPGLSKGYENGMIKEWELPVEEWFREREVLTPYIFIRDLKNHGLDGIEIYNYRANDKPHAENHELINQYFVELAKRLELITTAGSDCHGPKGKGPLMGTFGLTSSSKNLLDFILKPGRR